MKHLAAAALAASLMSACATNGALAQNPGGLYGEVRLGSTNIPNADFEELGATGEIVYEPGGSFDLTFGTSFANGARLEYQFGLRVAAVDEVTIDGLGTFPGAADLVTYTNMLNLYYDFDFKRMAGSPEGSSRLVPYIGGGIGVAVHEFQSDFGGTVSDTVLAYQGIAGLGYSFTPTLIGTITYAFLDTPDPKFNDFETEYQSHNVMLGLRFFF